MKLRKRIALITVLVLMINLFAPYSVLFNTINTVSAATVSTPEEKPIVLNNLGINSKGVLTVQIAIVTKTALKGFDMQFKVDTTKLKPCRSTGTNGTTLKLVAPTSDYYLGTLSTISSYTSATGTYRIQGTEATGGIDLEEAGYVPGTMADNENIGDPDLDEYGSGFPVYYPIVDMYFKILDDSITEETLPLDLFELVPIPPDENGATALKTGAKIGYSPDGVGDKKNLPHDITAFASKGFVEAEKQVDSISVKKSPTNTTYTHGDTVALTGGVIEVTFDDGSTEDVSMEDPNVTIVTGTPANASKPMVEIRYKGKTATFPITVNDPIASLIVKTPMTNLEYNHDDPLNFTGLTLEATKKSGAKVSLTKDSPGVTTDAGIAGGILKASVDSSTFTQSTPAGELPVKGTQKINFTYEGKTVTQTVVVNDRIASIKVKSQPTNKNYKAGEPINLSGAVVEVTLESNTKSDINLPDGSVTLSTYNVNLVDAEQQISVSLGGKTAPETINVEWYDYVTGVTLVEPTDIEYDMGETINLAGGRLRPVWKVGGQKSVNLTMDMISPNSGITDTAGIKTITVTYTPNYQLHDGTAMPKESFTNTFEIDVINNITSIDITPPTKTRYNHGEGLGTDGTITLHYADLTTGTVPFSNATITESDGTTVVNMSPSLADYGTTNKVSKTLKIKYTQDGITGSADYPIEIINNMTGIAVTSTTHKKQYNVGDSLDVTDLEITITRALGTSTKAVSADMVSTLDTSQENANVPLVVTYEENGITKQTTFNVSVVDSIKRIVSVNLPKKNYKYNEELDLTGAKVRVEMGSGEKDVDLTSSMITGYDKTVLGDHPLTITYAGKIYTGNADKSDVTVNVKDYVDKITLTPDVVTGAYGTEMSKLISDNSITYTVHYAKAGDKTPAQTLTDSMVAGYNKNTLDPQSLTVNYVDTDANSATNGQTIKGQLSVTLANSITGITITPPTKDKYNHGENINTAGASVAITYANGTSKAGDLSKLKFYESDGTTSLSMSPASYDSTNKLTKPVVISYTEGTKTETKPWNVTIINDIQGIAVVSTDHKTVYNVNEPLDTSKLKISVTRAVGTPSTVDVTPGMVSNFSSVAETTGLPLTITYTENDISQTTTYNITVADSVTGITIKTPPPVSQKYNTEGNIDLTGAEITVTSGKGTREIAITKEMLSGYDMEVLGDQTVTVTYADFTDTFPIKVKDYVDYITIDPSEAEGTVKEALQDIIDRLNVTYTVHYAKAGNKDAVALATSMLKGTTPYDPNSTTAQTLTFVYKDSDTNSYSYGDDIEKDFKVTLSNKIVGITIKTPDKNKYNHGESINTQGAKVTLTYADNTTEDGDLSKLKFYEVDGTTPLNMSPASFDSTNKLTKPVVVSYTEGGKTVTQNWEVTIINDIQGITVVSTDHKTSYNVNEALDTDKLKISVTRAVGAPSTVDVTPGMVSGFNSTAETTGLPLTITYTENDISQQTTYNITVADSVIGISIKTPPKDKYKYNEELDLTGAEITVTSGKGTKDIAITSGMISGYNKTDLGDQTVTVTYGGKTATFVVNVKDYVTGITINPNPVSGDVGNELVKLISDNNITYTVNYAKAGAQTAQALTTSMVNGYNKMTKGTQNLTVDYLDTDANSFTNGTTLHEPFVVNLANKVTAITITPPTKDKYNHGENINTQGATVTLTYADTTTENGDLSKLKFYESDGTTPLNMSPASYDSTNKLTKPVVISYTEGTKTETIPWNVTIINDIQGIAVVSTDHKTSYNVNEALDTDKLKISVTRAVGAPTTVDVTPGMVSNFNSSTETTGLPLTITYTENDITQTTTYNITVADSVTGISIKTPPKDKYKYNEELDLTGAEITVTSGKGTKDIQITQDMISGYNKTDLGDQTVTVTYGGKTATFVVNVKDYITGITVTPSSVNGEVGKELSDIITDNSITYTVNYAKAGPQTAQPVTESMVPGYDKNSKAIQNLKVEYTDTNSLSFTNGTTFRGDLSILLVNKVSDVTITVPTKDKYKHGESLNTAGGEITLEYSDGTTSSVPITTAMIKEADGSEVNMSPSTYDSTQKVSKTLKIEYTAPNGKKYDIPYPITIVNEITGIKMKDYPKQNYNIGDTENLLGGTIEVTRLSGDPQTINLTDSKVTVTGFDASSEKTVTINVAYTENEVTKNTSYDINITDRIEKIEFENTPKSDYRHGDKLDHTGTLKVTKSSGTSIVQITKDMITEMDGSPFDSTKIGPRKLKVTYMGETLTYDINVKDYVKSIKVKGPDKDIYNIGETLNLAGAEVIEVMASGLEKPGIPITEDMISAFDSSTAGTKTITVTHEELTGTFKVTVQDETSDVQLVSYPDKTEYKFGEKLDLTGGKIKLIKASGAEEELDITMDMVSGYDANDIGKQTITITYEGKYLGEYEVTVEDEISHLKVNPSKTKYKYGEDLDLEGATVQVIMKSGAVDETADLTEDMVSDYDKTAVGSQIIYVEYKGLKATFDVEVEDELVNVRLASEPYKIRYQYGENIDLNGAMLEVTKRSGSYMVQVTRDMITGYNANEAGPQVITVRYEGYEFKFIVIVEEKKEEPKPTPAPTPVPTPKPTPVPTPVPTPKPVTPNRELPVVEIPERPEYEEPVYPTYEPDPTPTPTPKPTQKPTETLGVKEKKKDNTVIAASIAGLMGFLLLALLVASRRNTKIYVEENGEFELGGAKKLTKRRMYIDIDKYLDENTSLNRVKVVLNKKIAKKLEGELIEVKHRGVSKRFRVEYNDDKFEFILD